MHEETEAEDEEPPQVQVRVGEVKEQVEVVQLLVKQLSGSAFQVR